MPIARSSCVLAITVLLATGGAVCARAGETEDPRGPRTGCPIVDVMTPGGVVPERVCTAAPTPRPVGAFMPLMQRYPRPMPRRAWPLQYPPLREVGIHVSGNITGDMFSMGGVSYTRSLTDTFALEGTGDVTHQSGDVVGFASLRALLRRYDPEVGEVFFALGVARGFSGGNAILYPQGRGFVIGGGIQPRFSRRAAGRLEAQLVTFSHQMVGLRLTTGLLVGFD